MTPMECEFEADVLAAAMAGSLNTQLSEHVKQCPLCSEVALVASAIREEERKAAVPALPSAEAVWWRAQWRARREAVQAASRPITAAHAMAFGAAMGLFGACFGAMSTGLQRLVTETISLSHHAFVAAGPYGGVLVAAGAVLLMLPLAIWLALLRN